MPSTTACTKAYRHGHVRGHAGHQRVFVDVMEVPGWRAAVVVDQDVDLRHGPGQPSPPDGGIDVGDHRDHGGAGRIPDLRCGVFGGRRLPAVDDDGAPGLGKFESAGLAEAFARRADDGHPTGDSQVHLRPLSVPDKS
jgi:hypothetical protein